LLLGGWNFSGITRVQSGLPFTPTVFSAPNVGADLTVYVLTRLAIRTWPTRTRICGFIRLPTSLPLLSAETAMLAMIRCAVPVITNWTSRWARSSPILAENKTLEFKWETYNLTNHVNLANPSNTNIDTTGAGQITAADIMRQMQFGLHFCF
jgi:hypothetical protein